MLLAWDMAMNDVIDITHSDSIRARRWVNGLFGDAKRRASTWEPAPYPSFEGRTRDRAHLEVVDDEHHGSPSTQVDPLLRPQLPRWRRRQR